MKPQLFALALLGAAATSSHAAPVQAPKLAPAPTYCAPDPNVDLMEAFVRLPDYLFQYFGGTNNNVTSLLDRKGVTVDRKNGFIDIPYEGNSSHPRRAEVYDWQLKMFYTPSGSPVAVVTSSINSPSKLKPFIHTFRFKNGYPYRTTGKDFPYQVDSENYGQGTIYYNFHPPITGNVISSFLPRSDGRGYSYRWTGQKFVRFIPKDEGNY